MFDFNWSPSYPWNCTRELWSEMCRVFGRLGTSNRIGSQNQYICLYWSLAAIKGLLIWIFLNFLKTPGWQSRIKNRANAMSLTKMDTMKRLFLWVELALSDFLQISLKSDLYPFPQFVMKENDGNQERVKQRQVWGAGRRGWAGRHLPLGAFPQSPPKEGCTPCHLQGQGCWCSGVVWLRLPSLASSSGC